MKGAIISALAATALAMPSPKVARSTDTTQWGYGLAYSPYKSDGSCKQPSDVTTDFGAFSGYGLIRLYGTDCDQTAMVLAAAQPLGMKIMAGVFDITQVSTEVQTIIDAANGDWSGIDTVSIGNEGVNDGTYTVDAVVSAIGTARSMLSGAGFGGNVVTVDTFNAIIANPALCQASDFAAANCHAFFTNTETSSDAGNYVLSQAQQVSQACGGMNTVITESGWPSAGQTNGAAVPSPQDQQTAISALKASFSNNIILFSAFNDHWKQDNSGTFGAEQYWGIYGDSSTE